MKLTWCVLSLTSRRHADTHTIYVCLLARLERGAFFHGRPSSTLRRGEGGQLDTLHASRLKCNELATVAGLLREAAKEMLASRRKRKNKAATG